MDSWDTIKLVDFVDSIDIGCSSEVNIFVEGCRNHLLCCTAHDLL